MDEDRQYKAVSKHMYKDSKLMVTVSLDCDKDKDGVEISWLLRMSPCAMEFISATDEINVLKSQEGIGLYMIKPYNESSLVYNKVEWMNGSSSHNCSEEEFKLEGMPGQKLQVFNVPQTAKNSTTQSKTSDSSAAGSGTENAAGSSPAPKTPAPPNAPSSPDQSGPDKEGASADTGKPGTGAGTPVPSNSDTAHKGGATPGPSGSKATSSPPSRKKRAESAGGDTSSATEVPRSAGKPNQLDHPVVASTWVDGNYLFVIHLHPKKKGSTFKAQVTIRTFYGEENFISAMDYPLLIFYGIMGLVYIVYGLVWLVLLACNWRDLLRVQFWIGGVILLGMLEKAVFFAEYENINKTGQSVHGAVIFAELVSCLKRTLARMLVIIVSLGFGIVKPRLGQAFHKVLFVGGLYFILASIEGCMRASSPKADQSSQFLLAAVPLAVLEAIICWWIFSSLIQTTRTLRLRRNVVKLTLYRHFTNTLIFAVLASVAYMIWFMTQHKFKQCIKDWKQLWVDEAFWHLLFVILLFIIMLLWRPTANNQRYAFSPLLDAADEEDEEDAMMNDAFDGMKMRGVKATNGSPQQRDPRSKVEDDLKWVEENIPSSVADKALPALLDSDEELMTTKFEMSKME
ncbi:transmembrane protein 87A-like isoform X3 [Babylonia areolata]|uniref:transmembrane protein 87A-like isoform X3 n=1 Tax=Babylonia areolata TaxID=304850 RepID=UPI003FCFD61F